jgi:hypothetical protein
MMPIGRSFREASSGGDAVRSTEEEEGRFTGLSQPSSWSRAVSGSESSLSSSSESRHPIPVMSFPGSRESSRLGLSPQTVPSSISISSGSSRGSHDNGSIPPARRDGPARSLASGAPPPGSAVLMPRRPPPAQGVPSSISSSSESSRGSHSSGPIQSHGFAPRSDSRAPNRAPAPSLPAPSLVPAPRLAPAPSPALPSRLTGLTVTRRRPPPLPLNLGPSRPQASTGATVPPAATPPITPRRPGGGATVHHGMNAFETARTHTQQPPAPGVTAVIPGLVVPRTPTTPRAAQPGPFGGATVFLGNNAYEVAQHFTGERPAVGATVLIPGLGPPRIPAATTPAATPPAPPRPSAAKQPRGAGWI